MLGGSGLAVSLSFFSGTCGLLKAGNASLPGVRLYWLKFVQDLVCTTGSCK